MILSNYRLNENDFHILAWIVAETSFKKNDVVVKNKKVLSFERTFLVYSIGNLLGVPGLRGYLLGVSFVLVIT